MEAKAITAGIAATANFFEIFIKFPSLVININTKVPKKRGLLNKIMLLSSELRKFVA